MILGFLDGFWMLLGRRVVGYNFNSCVFGGTDMV